MSMNTWNIKEEKSFYMEAAKEQQSRPQKEKKKNFLEHVYHNQMQQEQKKRNWNVSEECVKREIRR